MPDYLFQLPQQSDANLQSQVREMLVTAILDGHIPAGSTLPSCRRLATQLGVSRNTVVLAYERLVAEGFLVSRERSGYYVNADILEGQVAPPVMATERDSAGAGPDWTARLVQQPSRQANIEKPRDWQSYRYPFIYGQFDSHLFPMAEWRECCRQALSIVQVRRWAADSVDSDDPLLVEEIRTRVLPRRGVWADNEQILVTLGAQHALYLLASLLLKPGVVIGVEDPGYVDARNIFATFSDRVVPLAVDDQGLVAGRQLQGCRYVFVTPSHQHPTTVTMSLQRRHALLQAAETQDFLIVEDDYEPETNYIGQPTPALKSLDPGQRVIYVGSLSKTLAPGLRLGYMVGPAELIREARALRRLMLRHPPRNNERAAALFLARGYHDALVRRLTHAYRVRWERMGELLEHYLPNSSRPPTFGGTAYWVTGPPGLDADLLARSAAREGVLIEPGGVCFMDPKAPANRFRLGFSSISEDQLEPGIRILASLIDAQMSRRQQLPD
jgi:GntR family transcriptional regulator/MocR family aminotransferase